MNKKHTVSTIKKSKNNEKLVMITAYDALFAKLLESSADIILVGDSLGMVLYGMNTTRKIKIETMILHAKTVKDFARKSLVVFDMPYKTYENKFIAYIPT